MRLLTALAACTFALGVVHCSSDDAADTEPTSDGGSSGQPQQGGSSGQSSGQSASSSGSSSSTATVTPIAADQPIAPVTIAALPNGHLVLPEGQPKRVVEMDLEGHVVGINTTDYVDFEWPNEAVVDADTSRIFIAAEYQIYVHAGTVTAPRTTYLSDAEGKLSNLGWGGTPRRLWALRGTSSNSPTVSLVRYDAATATEGGAATVILADLPRSAYGPIYVDADNDAFLADGNTCRLLKVTAAGVASVLAGPALGASGNCYNGGTVGKIEYVVGQGSSLGLDPGGSFLVFSDGANRAFLDVGPGADGRSKATRAVVSFPQAIQNGRFTTVQGSYYVIDDAAKAVVRATPN